MRGWISFYNEGSVPPPSLDASGRISLYYATSLMPHVMELLRVEKPLLLYYNSATFAGLGSSNEPVGEQEA